jgi:uncharacterized SAM-binding protein YcdF (DUF218 family)
MLVIRRFLLMVAGGLMLWIAGFFLFVGLVSSPTRATKNADAIVVLTGGKGRVEHGFKALAAGHAPVLFISGVGKDVTLPEMIAAHTNGETRAAIAARRPRILLDYRANSTRTNAEETALFAAKYRVHSIRLVTAHYHMPRSLLEFRDAMPGVSILADPVLPEEAENAPWWHDAHLRELMLSEYVKYQGTLLMQLVY